MISQIVVQETTSNVRRALIQLGNVTDINSLKQYEIEYDKLSKDEQVIYDGFINLMNNKIK